MSSHVVTLSGPQLLAIFDGLARGRLFRRAELAEEGLWFTEEAQRVTQRWAAYAVSPMGQLAGCPQLGCELCGEQAATCERQSELNAIEYRLSFHRSNLRTVSDEYDIAWGRREALCENFAGFTQAEWEATQYHISNPQVVTCVMPKQQQGKEGTDGSSTTTGPA